jgi:hypothetical protein
MKMRAFWDMATCSLIEVYRYFKVAHCLHHQGDIVQKAAVSYSPP